MSDQFVQVGTGGIGTTTATDTLTGVTPGNTIVAFLFDGTTTTPGVFSVSDGTAYTQVGSNVTDSGNVICSGVFVLQNVVGTTHAVVGTGASGNAMFIVAVEVQAPTAWTTTGLSSGADQVSPGAGANILNSGTITFATASTIVSILNDNSSVNTSDEPTAGTSPIAFTSRGSNANANIGAWRVQTAAASTNAAATGGPVTTTDHFITWGIAVPNAAGGGATGPAATPMGRRYWVNP